MAVFGRARISFLFSFSLRCKGGNGLVLWEGISPFKVY